jgi:hypothetical protein
MICAKCKEMGLKSQVNSGSTLTTLMGTFPFYDEDGVYHDHDFNTISTDYRCTNNHNFTKSYRKSCPSPDCEWNNDLKERYIVHA